MWRIEYSQEVRNYIYDSYPYTETIWQTIKSLRHTLDGYPNTHYIELASNLIQWEIADHTVIYERHPEQQRLLVRVLKPAP
ncbi:MAG: hypothetical protein U0350_40030 [Caldilineaceae bacterium]